MISVLLINCVFVYSLLTLERAKKDRLKKFCARGGVANKKGSRVVWREQIARFLL